MKDIKGGIKRILPAKAVHLGRDTIDAMGRVPDWPAATFHPWRIDTKKRLHPFHNIHKGERCFVLGNGPSLKNTDLTKLRNEKTLGMNRIYLLFNDLGYQTSYYLSVNDLVVEQCAEDIQHLNIPRFVSWRSRKWLQPEANLFFLYTTYTGPGFSTNLSGRLWEGATVTYVALQVAFFLGFQEVYLIGVDHNFTTQGKPNTTVVSQGDDPNHFSPQYFGKGFRWQLPDLETSERAYQMAREAYENAGRKIFDATIGGQLQVFEKVEYNSLF